MSVVMNAVCRVQEIMENWGWNKTMLPDQNRGIPLCMTTIIFTIVAPPWCWQLLRAKGSDGRSDISYRTLTHSLSLGALGYVCVFAREREREHTNQRREKEKKFWFMKHHLSPVTSVHRFHWRRRASWCCTRNCCPCAGPTATSRTQI